MDKIVLKRGTQVTVEVEDLAFQGRGVAKIEGLVVFIDGGLPGDMARIEITRKRRRHLESKVIEILRPSPYRIEPKCAHFGLCGGCRLQDLAYERQLAFKAAQVRNHLVRIGGLDDLGEIPIIPCEPTFGYRNKMEFTFGTDADRQPALGLHPRGKYWEVFDLRECHLPPENFARIVAITRDFFADTAHQPYHPREHTGFLRFLVIRVGQNTGRILINLVTAAGEVDGAANWVAALREAVPEIVSVVHTINNKRANIAVGDLAAIWHGDGTFAERLGDFAYTLGPQSFFQTNTLQAEKLFAKAIEFAGITGEDNVLDLYSGAGAISLLAAKNAKSVTGVELVPEAVTAAREAAASNGVTNCEFICDDARDFMQKQSALGVRYDLVITDPPRAGLHPKVIKRLNELAPPKIVYVSCNPSTLARDLGLFCAGGYRLEDITAVDMFPHTAHIEAVALLRFGEKK
jgi:23S rRNA (uracil1939-C5)-methyltransferase